MKKSILSLLVLSSAIGMSSCTAVATTSNATPGPTYVGLGSPGYYWGGVYPGFTDFRYPEYSYYRYYGSRTFYGPRVYRHGWGY